MRHRYILNQNKTILEEDIGGYDPPNGCKRPSCRLLYIFSHGIERRTYERHRIFKKKAK